MSGEVETHLKRLAATPHRIASACAGVDEARLRLSPDADGWSVNDILAHLRACADVWGKSILAMIEQDHPTIRHVSPRTYIRKTNYPSLEFHASLAAFTRQREELLRVLTALEIRDWARGATFTGTTRWREQTVLSKAQAMAAHEELHCAQIETVLAQVSDA